MNIMLDGTALMPKRGHATDAGLDLLSPVDTVIPAHGAVTIDTGIHIELTPNTAGFLKSKSGLNVKYGITSEGVIDVATPEVLPSSCTTTAVWIILYAVGTRSASWWWSISTLRIWCWWTSWRTPNAEMAGSGVQVAKEAPNVKVKAEELRRCQGYLSLL